MNAPGPDERLHSLLSLTERLIAMVEEENAQVNAGNRGILREHQEEKDRLSRQYTDELKAVRAAPDQFKGANPALREKVRSATRRLDKAMEKHSLIAMALFQVAENLIKAIRDATIAKRQPITGYGRDGAVSRIPSGYGSRFVPIAYHQVV